MFVVCVEVAVAKTALRCSSVISTAILDVFLFVRNLFTHVGGFKYSEHIPAKTFKLEYLYSTIQRNSINSA